MDGEGGEGRCAGLKWALAWKHRLLFSKKPIQLLITLSPVSSFCQSGVEVDAIDSPMLTMTKYRSAITYDTWTLTNYEINADKLEDS